MDAKVYAMIEDLDRYSLFNLLTPSCTEIRSTDKLRQLVREGYEAGTIHGDDIVASWEDSE